MHFIKALAPVLLASAAIAAPLTKRTLLTDISTIASDVATLTTAVNGFTGGLIQALDLDIDFSDLKSAIDTATTAATDSAALDTADSTALTAAVTPLVTSILAVITDLEAKESVAGSYTTDILDALNTLRNHSSNLFAAVIPIVDTADAATISGYATEVYDALTAAIAVY